MTLSTSPETPQATAPLLTIEGLTVRFGSTKVIEDLSFSVQPGRTVAVVGESGSGKSVTSLSVMRLADMMGARFDTGRILFGGRNLLETSQKDMRSIRGKEIAMIFQEPMTSLNPVFTIGDQISEVLMLHEKSSKAAALAEAQRLLEMVRLPDAAEQLKRYPHQLSGGMRQRVMIAMALACRPRLLIADEPTTALDVTIQSQILSEVQVLCRELGMGLIWISHDLGVVAGLADRIAVMYAGRIVEQGDVDQILDRPKHPYTAGLIGSAPAANRRGERLTQIRGSAPHPLRRPEGCAFRTRCDFSTDACLQEPPETIGAADHRWRCFNPLGATEAAS